MSGGRYGRGKAPERACMKCKDWPETDRSLWHAALAPADPFADEGGTRSHYRSHSNRKVENGYGRWLTFLSQRGVLELASQPADRITHERVLDYVKHLDSSGNSKATVSNRLQELLAMAQTFESTRDWRFINRLMSRVRARPDAPSTKRARIVGSAELLDLGLRLMEEADQASTARLAAICFRDGLIIALLSLVPLRRGNLASLAMGTTLVPESEGWTILIPSSASKNHEPLAFPWPDLLLPHLEAYLAQHRPVLAAQVHRWTTATGDSLWVSSHGSPMTEIAIYDTIRKRTAEAFGRAINPHLFRDEAATALAIHDPDHVRSAAPLLGHRSLSTTERYYQQAQSLEAQRAFAKTVLAIRNTGEK